MIPMAVEDTTRAVFVVKKCLHKLKSSTFPPGLQKPTLVNQLQDVASHDTFYSIN